MSTNTEIGSLFLIYSGCPNCGGPITDRRSILGLPCERCLSEDGGVCENLKKSGFLREICEIEENLREFSEVFEKCVGFEPWSLQRTWAKRYLMKRSFAIVAPTGVGKTTFGLVASILAKKSLLIFPTRVLSEQAYERIRHFLEKLGIERKVLVYKGRKKDKEILESGDFDILLGTNIFLHKNLEVLSKIPFTFIFVDDTDSFLKSSKNIEGIFKLLGFSEREISLALKERKTEEDLKELEKIREREGKTVLIISSATLKPKTKRVILFKNLLGFDIQRAVSTVRKVVDSVKWVESMDNAIAQLPTLIKKLGKGGLLFVSARYGREKVEEVSNYLKNEGFKVLNYLELSPSNLYKEMEKGDFDVAIGLANIGNPLVRGIDLPGVIRYAIFLDVPKFVFPVKTEINPSSVYNLLVSVYPILESEEKIKAGNYIRILSKYRAIKDIENYPKIKDRVLEAYNFISSKFSDESFINKINESDEVSLERINEELYVTVADAATYIQASGRTSRLVAGGLTRGLSLILYWDKKALRSLEKRLIYYFHTFEVEIKEFESLNLEEILREIDEDRRRFREGKGGGGDIFKTTLVVVESPNKARTIAGFFGKPQTRIVKGAVFYDIPLGDRVLSITASLGHILDLKTEGGFFGVLEENGKFLGIYDTIKRCKKTGEQHTEIEYLRKVCGDGEILDKISTVQALRSVAYEVDEVFIATDPDAEGEKIAYDIYALISPFNRRIYRAEFHEVTPRAFVEALREMREFNINRVKAQITRRIADRWVGFTLSQILWRVFNKKDLSAGRVQTPVLGWIIERNEEFKKKIDKVVLDLGGREIAFLVEDKALAYEMQREPEKIRVMWGKEWEEEKGPPPPYTTDTILQDSRLPADKTMEILQELFEKGFITYHRTDSTRVSEFGKYFVAKPIIAKDFGEEMFYPRSWGEGGAHECIRPTRPIRPDELRLMMSLGNVEFEDPKNTLRIYSLIFNRFLASQMRPAKVKSAEIIVLYNGFAYVEEVVREILQDGYNLVFPNIRVWDGELQVKGVNFLKVPKVQPYTQGTLIQEMKRRGLGRPSTYAQIVKTLLERGYVVEKKGYLFPTKMGIVVYKFLSGKFGEFVSEEFTRKLEEEMDIIEEGKKDFVETLREIYGIKGYLQP